jgi:hypothetical protein
VKRWAVIAAVVAAVATPFWAVYWAGSRLWAAVAVADRDDPHWRLADLMAAREAVPDAVNGAIPVAEAAAKLPNPWPPAPGPAEAAGELTFRAAFDRATNAEGPARLDDETLAVLRTELAVRADALAVARKLAGFARGRLEVVIAPNILDTKYEETNDARRVARLLQADAIVAAHDGRPDDAIAACRAMLGVGRTIGDEPGEIPQLVRGAIDRASVHTILATLAWGEPSAEALAAAERDVLTALAEPIERHALGGERALSFEMFERFKSDPSLLSSDKDKPTPGFLSVAWLPFLAWQQVLLLEWSNELAAIAERPTPEWLPAVAEWQARFEAREASRVSSGFGVLAFLLAPTSADMFEHWMSRRAYLGTAAIILAAERRRMETGEWPGALAEIPMDTLPEPPLDPYTEEPFRLRHAEGRLRVYSPGPNLKDEGGAYDLKTWKDKIGRDDVGTYAYDPELRGRPAVDAQGPEPPGS